MSMDGPTIFDVFYWGSDAPSDMLLPDSNWRSVDLDVPDREDMFLGMQQPQQCDCAYLEIGSVDPLRP